MNINDQLIHLGWSVKTEVIDGSIQRLDDIKKQLLDSDLRHTGEKSLPEMAKLDQTTKPYIVQLHDTRNVSARKDKETSSTRPHLYRLTITDGHVYQNALILPSLSNFNLDTPPGVKLLIKPKTKISNGFYILNDETCEVLGGTVNELVQNWRLNKLMGNHAQILVGEDPPPVWYPFGSIQTSSTTVDISQRSMDVVKKQHTGIEDLDFVRKRRAEIATLLTDQISKRQRFTTERVLKAKNLKKASSQRKSIKRPNTDSSSVPKKLTTMAATATAIKTSTRLSKWAKYQITDETTEDNTRRGRKRIDDD